MKGGKAMADSPLIIKSKAFALDVIQVCKDLRVAKCESALINQFLRSGTSIGGITFCFASKFICIISFWMPHIKDAW